MKTSSLTGTGGVLSAVLASFCCIGPVVLALLGVGGLGMFSVFEEYRPWFIALTVILLGAAFYFTYRKREVACEDGSCEIRSAGKWNKISVWLATVIAAVAIAFPYIGVLPSPDVNAAVQPGASVVLEIEGMTCNACASGLEQSLADVKGVREASVQYEEERANIVYDPETVSPEVFVRLVQEAGYKARVEKSSVQSPGATKKEAQ